MAAAWDLRTVPTLVEELALVLGETERCKCSSSRHCLPRSPGSSSLLVKCECKLATHSIPQPSSGSSTPPSAAAEAPIKAVRHCGLRKSQILAAPEHDAVQIAGTCRCANGKNVPMPYAGDPRSRSMWFDCDQSLLSHASCNLPGVRRTLSTPCLVAAGSRKRIEPMCSGPRKRDGSC